MGRTWALIPCSKRKLDRPARAQDLYWPSALVRGAWRVATSWGQIPVILSARHGLVQPGDWLDPYDEALRGLSRSERARWAGRVLSALIPMLQPGDRAVSYLGQVYGEFVIPAIREAGFPVDEPIRGLGQGRRLQWFRQQLDTGGPQRTEETCPCCHSAG